MSLQRHTEMPRGEGSKRSGMPPRKAWMPRGEGFKPRGWQEPVKPGAPPRAPRKPKARKDTGAPQAVRDMVFDRDRWCVRCGKALAKGQEGYSIHHRVLRSHGTDNSPQNQVLLCGSGSTACHGWAHAHPAAAMAAGWILPGNANVDPASEPVMIAQPSGYAWYLLTATGERHGTEAPERAAA